MSLARRRMCRGVGVKVQGQGTRGQEEHPDKKHAPDLGNVNHILLLNVLKVDPVAQVEGQRDGQDVKGPPSGFVSHDMFEHQSLLLGSLFQDQVPQRVHQGDAGQVDQPPARRQEGCLPPEVPLKIGHCAPPV